MEQDRTEVIETHPTHGEVVRDERAVPSRVTQLVYWVFGLVEGLIAIRLILKVLGANPSAGFAEFIYGTSAPVVAPFFPLFSNPAYGSSVLELGSLVALIVYALVAWLIAKLVWILLGDTRSAIHTHTHQMDTRI